MRRGEEGVQRILAVHQAGHHAPEDSAEIDCTVLREVRGTTRKDQATERKTKRVPEGGERMRRPLDEGCDHQID